jgi:hypothetical protein
MCQALYGRSKSTARRHKLNEDPLLGVGSFGADRFPRARAQSGLTPRAFAPPAATR